MILAGILTYKLVKRTKLLYDQMAFPFFFFQAEDGIRDIGVTGVQTCALPIFLRTARLEQLGVSRQTARDVARLVRLAADLGEDRSRRDLVSVLDGELRAHRDDEVRSEERRGGKECRSRWWPVRSKEKARHRGG